MNEEFHAEVDGRLVENPDSVRAACTVAGSVVPPHYLWTEMSKHRKPRNSAVTSPRSVRIGVTVAAAAGIFASTPSAWAAVGGDEGQTSQVPFDRDAVAQELRGNLQKLEAALGNPDVVQQLGRDEIVRGKETFERRLDERLAILREQPNLSPELQRLNPKKVALPVVGSSGKKGVYESVWTYEVHPGIRVAGVYNVAERGAFDLVNRTPDPVPDTELLKFIKDTEQNIAYLKSNGSSGALIDFFGKNRFVKRQDGSEVRLKTADGAETLEDGVVIGPTRQEKVEVVKGGVRETVEFGRPKAGALYPAAAQDRITGSPSLVQYDARSVTNIRTGEKGEEFHLWPADALGHELTHSAHHNSGTSYGEEGLRYTTGNGLMDKLRGKSGKTYAVPYEELFTHSDPEARKIAAETEGVSERVTRKVGGKTITLALGPAERDARVKLRERVAQEPDLQSVLEARESILGLGESQYLRDSGRAPRPQYRGPEGASAADKWIYRNYKVASNVDLSRLPADYKTIEYAERAGDIAEITPPSGCSHGSLVCANPSEAETTEFREASPESIGIEHDEIKPPGASSLEEEAERAVGKQVEKIFGDLAAKHVVSATIRDGQKVSALSPSDIHARIQQYNRLSPEVKAKVRGTLKSAGSVGGKALGAAGATLWAKGVYDSYANDTTTLDKAAAITSIVPFAGCGTQAGSDADHGRFNADDLTECLAGDALLQTPLWPAGLATHGARYFNAKWQEAQIPSLDAFKQARDEGWAKELEHFRVNDFPRLVKSVAETERQQLEAEKALILHNSAERIAKIERSDRSPLAKRLLRFSAEREVTEQLKELAPKVRKQYDAELRNILVERAKQYNDDFIKQQIDVDQWKDESWQATLRGPSQSREDRQEYLDKLIQRLRDSDQLPPIPDAKTFDQEIEKARGVLAKTDALSAPEPNGTPQSDKPDAPPEAATQQEEEQNTGLGLGDAPVEDKPVTDVPVEDKPAAGAPVEDQPSVDTSAQGQPVTGAPVEDKPVTDASVQDKPVTDTPVYDQLMAEREQQNGTVDSAKSSEELPEAAQEPVADGLEGEHSDTVAPVTDGVSTEESQNEIRSSSPAEQEPAPSVSRPDY
ncbi:hypothetical protein AB0C51_09660 [Streptomyces pathocidini]|uniref:hypothetical protein n=1 Tax=Streptomyces pathocidini TaxID=1650571 RepID=UPI0033CCF72B